MNSVESILHKEGAFLSSDLTKKLVDLYGISNEAARKRVSRGSPNVKRLAYINFPKNAKFIYLKSDFGSPEKYWEPLEKALAENPSCYSMAYDAIKHRGGVIPESHFDCICGSPKRQKKHVPSKTVMENMIKSNILVRRDISGVGKCLVTGVEGREKASYLLDETAKEVASRLVVENAVAIPLISRWLKNIGFTSKNSIKNRTGGVFPKVINFEWDITASSYLNILSNFNNDKVNPGFIACDIFIEENVNSKVVDTYIKKTKTCSGASKNTKVLYILVVKSFTYDALIMARKNSGILAITLDDMLGKRLSEGVFNLIGTLKDVLSSSINSNNFKQILKSFEGIKGIYGNVRGTLFEFLCCDILRLPTAYTIERSKKIKTQNGDSEIDVYAFLPNKERRYIECKSWKKTSNHSEILTWLNTRIPNTIKSIREEEGFDFSKIRVKMELWVTCKISDESMKLIQERAKAVKKYDIIVYDAEDIRQMTNENGNPELIKTYKEMFLDFKDKYAIPSVSVDLVSTSIDEPKVSFDGFDNDIPF